MRKLKAAVIGAGSTYTPELIDGFLKRKDRLDVESLYMMDIDARKNAIVSGFAERMIKKSGLNTRLVITDDLENALDGADYVIAQVRVGKLPARVLDEKIPLKHGLIGQETTGVGGFFKALRTIPVLLNAARIMERVCPDAWLINFSNPSGIIAQMLAQETKVNVVGLCNGPILQEKYFYEKAGSPEQFNFDFVGLNHFNWITRVEANGVNRMPEWLAGDIDEVTRVTRGLSSGYLNYYYNRASTLKWLKEQKTSRGEDCMAIEEELLAMYQDENLNEKPPQLDKRGGAMYSEAAVSLVDAIENDLDTIHVVNTNHKGTLLFMDAADIAEVKCRVGKDGPVPIPLTDPNISRHIIGMMRAVKAYERLTVEAGVTGDYDTGLAALLTHPMIGDFAAAKAVYDEMLEAHKTYLPQFFK
ncbi:MAG: 6-phospho-beta-glucosidase [Defluviitaleaceae bacterium]|nr:6-phospho-beta-glucosidase [Defluviitaleaceae bacterium]